jgi:hypothetical protein
MTRPDKLPREVAVPEWIRDDTSITISTTIGKVQVNLDCRALLPNDVIVTGSLIYRGNQYQVRWEHTTDDGDPYIYDNQGQERLVLTTLPTEGFEQWRIGEWLGGAPKTFRQPLLDAVKAAVRLYIMENPEHVRASRRANLVQDVNRKGSDYNRKADEAATALTEYNKKLVALHLFDNGVEA